MSASVPGGSVVAGCILVGVVADQFARLIFLISRSGHSAVPDQSPARAAVPGVLSGGRPVNGGDELTRGPRPAPQVAAPPGPSGASGAIGVVPEQCHPSSVPAPPHRLTGSVSAWRRSQARNEHRGGPGGGGGPDRGGVGQLRGIEGSSADRDQLPRPAQRHRRRCRLELPGGPYRRCRRPVGPGHVEAFLSGGPRTAALPRARGQAARQRPSGPGTRRGSWPHPGDETYSS